MRITLSGNNIYYFVNGDLVGSGSFTRPAADKFYIKSSGTVYLDELRVTTGSLSSTGVYTPSSAPYDTNKVLALPDKLTTGTIYVQSNVNVTTCRIGGVRPSNPSKGFFYIPLHSDHTGGQPQIYDGNNWVDVTAMVYDGSKTVTALGFQFSPVGSLPDVDTDAKPERPSKPGDDVDPDTCKHNWEETKRTDATCTLPGTVTSTCTKCEKTKTETLPKVGHTWEVKQTTQTSYDENGNVLTQGFTIYRCSVCGEEYKDTDGTGPPAGCSTATAPIKRPSPTGRQNIPPKNPLKVQVQNMVIPLRIGWMLILLMISILWAVILMPMAGYGPRPVNCSPRTPYRLRRLWKRLKLRLTDWVTRLILRTRR